MAKDKMTTCKHCGQEIAASAKVCPHCGGKNKPPIYKRWWFIAIIVLVILYAIGSSGSSSSSSSSSSVASSSKTESSASSVAVSNTAASESASSTAVSAPSEPEISEDEYKAACETIKYKDLCRYPDQYVGTKISITVKVQQIMDASWLSNEKAWRVQTDNDGYGFYMDDEYYALDKRSSDSVKILQDDVVTIYGEFTGMTQITRALTNTQDEIPCVDVHFVDIIDE